MYEPIIVFLDDVSTVILTGFYMTVTGMGVLKGRWMSPRALFNSKL